MSLTVEDTNCADVLRILAQSTRLAVVRCLLDGAKHVGEMNRTLQVESSLLSHHLRTLREAGLVEARRDGKQVHYQLSPALRSRGDGMALDLGCCRLNFE